MKNTEVYASRHVSISIGCPSKKVYDFVSNPENLPRWAAGLSGSIEFKDGEWMAESPIGRVIVAFVSHNEFGILDHDVTLSSGEKVLNPMRVIQNGEGSEVVFSIFQRPEMTDMTFSEDADAVLADLRKLKSILE